MQPALAKQTRVRLAQLRKQYMASFPGKRRALQHAWQGISAKQSHAAHRENFRMLVHRIGGSAGGFGFQQLTQAAKKTEGALSQLQIAQTDQTQSTEMAYRHLAQTYAALCQVFDELCQQEATEPPVQLLRRPETAKGLLFIVIHEVEEARHLRRDCEACGYQVKTFSSPHQVVKETLRCQPQLVLLDMAFPEDHTGGFQLADALGQLGAKAPKLIFLSVGHDFQQRLAAVDYQPAICLEKPVELNLLRQQLKRIFENTQPLTGRVLIVDDDADMSVYYRLLFSEAGLESKIVAEPADLLPLLSTYCPDLILLDLYLPQCSGLALLTMIRQQGDRGLPIIFFSGESDAETIVQALEAGADTFLNKPINPRILVAQIKSHIQRFQS